MKNVKQKIGLASGVIGVILVSFGYTLESNIIWFVGNIIMFSYFKSKGEKELMIQMIFFSIITLWGIINLGILY